MSFWRRLVPDRTPQAAADWLIVGLGNPGDRYAHTRHNVGRDVVALLAERWAVSLDRVRDKARYGSGRFAALRVVLAIPLTYMNESGQAVGPLSRFFKFGPDRVLVLCDDMDLPVGVTRLRPGGGTAGHRGMQSLATALGTDSFPRLRIGIGRPPSGVDPADYVLARIDPEARAALLSATERSAQVVESALMEGIDAAMNRFN